jgi:hypothetical protein
VPAVPDVLKNSAIKNLVVSGHGRSPCRVSDCCCILQRPVPTRPIQNPWDVAESGAQSTNASRFGENCAHHRPCQMIVKSDAYMQCGAGDPARERLMIRSLHVRFCQTPP